MEGTREREIWFMVARTNNNKNGHRGASPLESQNSYVNVVNSERMSRIK